MSPTDFLKRLFCDQRGATAIEYGFIAALITIAIIGTLNGLAGETIKMWNNVEAKSQVAMSGS